MKREETTASDADNLAGACLRGNVDEVRNNIFLLAVRALCAEQAEQEYIGYATKQEELAETRQNRIEELEAALTALQSEHLAPEDDAKAKRRCKCEFSGGGVWAKKCAFHAAYLSERSALEQEAVVRKCAAVCEELDELLHAEMGNYDPSTGAVELPTRYTDISDAYDSCKFEILKILEKP